MWDPIAWLQSVWEAFWQQIIASVTSIIVTIIIGIVILAYKPALMFRWAKLTFRIRKAGRSLRFQSFFDFPLDNFDGDMVVLEEQLRHSGYFDEVQSVTVAHEKRIDLTLLLEGKRREYSLIQVLDEEGDFDAIRAVHVREISYGDIGDFVDLTVSARDEIHRSLFQADLKPGNLPHITIEMSWDSKTLSILPWLKQDYVFVGSIEIKESDIHIFQSDSGVAVGSSVVTREFKDILRSLVVDNMTK